MAFKDILLQIDSYPDPTPTEAIDQAVEFCRLIDGRVTGLAVEIDVHLKPGWLADALADVSRLAAAEEATSRQACEARLAHFKRQAEAAGVFGGAQTVKADYDGVGPIVARMARSRDLCIVPIVEFGDGQRMVAEDVLFDSARPTLVFRPKTAPLPAGRLGLVVLAWDGSRSAARALADSLPILTKAREVRVLTVINEKASVVSGAGQDVVRHLAAYGVLCTTVEVDGSHRRIGDVLNAYLTAEKADLLVMGAYGRSRMKEFVLGGATEHVLNNPVTGLLLSH